jgi:hypothetical protein
MMKQNRKQLVPEQGIMGHAYNSSTWEIEAGGLRVQGQPELHSETLSLKRKKLVSEMEMWNLDHFEARELVSSCDIWEYICNLNMGNIRFALISLSGQDIHILFQAIIVCISHWHTTLSPIPPC